MRKAKRYLKRILALGLAAVLVGTSADFGGLRAFAYSASETAGDRILEFGQLPEEIRVQELPTGSEESAIVFPDTLEVTVGGMSGKSGSPEMATASDATGSDAVASDATASDATASDASSSDAESYDEDGMLADGLVVNDLIELTGSEEIITLRDITWEPDPERSSRSSFSSETAGEQFVYLPVIPEKYDAAPDAELPEITVVIVPDHYYPAFEMTRMAGDIAVTVSAEEGVFPEDAVLSVELVPASSVYAADADAAVDRERDSHRNVAVSCTFDIKVLDRDGNELEPAGGNGVRVSFAMAEAANENLDASVYHLTETGGDEDAGLEAEKLDTVVDEGGGTVTVETDGFSLYTVEFTYSELQYVLPGGGRAALSEVLEAVGLKGAVQTVSVSDETLFKASEEDGQWFVQSLKAFNTTEWMKVSIGGLVYEITVTDAQRPAIRYLETIFWDGVVSTTTKECSNYTYMSEVADGTPLRDGWYYLSSDVSYSKCMTVQGHAHLILGNGRTLHCNDGVYIVKNSTLEIYREEGGIIGRLEAKADDGGPGIGGVHNTVGGHLLIHGGEITAEGAEDGAGIGGSDGTSGYQSIQINGGRVTARGGDGAAGIGGGLKNNDTDCGRIQINGGVVYAYGGGCHGAGIGGGKFRSGGPIQINGGSVVAYGTSRGPSILDKAGGAAIGGGDEASSNTIEINGGYVYAFADRHGAAIGGGYMGGVKSVTINGGEIKAEHMQYPEVDGDVQFSGAGIGAGRAAAQGGPITINGGTVHAGGEYGAGIGGGGNYGHDGGTVTITGGNVYATSIYGAGIGGGGTQGADASSLSEAFSGSGGTVTISGGNVFAASTAGGAGIGGGGHFTGNARGGSGGTVTITGGYVVAASENITRHWVDDMGQSTYIPAGMGEGFAYALANLILKMAFYAETYQLSAAAIGGGYNGDGGKVSITGGKVVCSSGSKGRAIGGGTSSIINGSLLIDDMVVRAGSNAADMTPYTSDPGAACKEHTYAEISKVYKVSFNLGGHGSPKPGDQAVEFGDYAVRPEDPADSSYVFVDWVDKNSQAFVFHHEPIREDTTVYAVWNPIKSADLQIRADWPAGADLPEAVEIDYRQTWIDRVLSEGTLTLRRDQGWTASIPVFMEATLTFAEKEEAGIEPPGWKLGNAELPVDDSGTCRLNFREIIDSALTLEDLARFINSGRVYLSVVQKVSETMKLSDKVVWEDEENQDGCRPDSVGIRVMADGVQAAETTAREADGWIWAVSGLPKTSSSGSRINYTVQADQIDRYTMTVDGYRVTYNHIPETTEATVQVLWDDENNYDGSRPENYSLTLMPVSREVTLDAAGGWSATVTDLPRYKESSEIRYFWEGTELPEGYSLKDFDEYGTLTSFYLFHEPVILWGDPVYEWADDNKSVTASRSSLKDPVRTETETVTASSEVTRKASCEEKGETTYTAEFENPAFETQTKTEADIPASGHTPGEEKKENEAEPDCINEGFYELTVCCSVCGKELSRTAKTVPALGHDWGSWEVARAASCETGGEEISVCRNDASHVQGRETPALGHDWGPWTVTVEATELKEGLETSICLRDTSHVQTRVIPRKGHVHRLTKKAAREPGCMEPGSIACWVCDQGENPCGRYFSDAGGSTEIGKEDITIPAVGHDWDGGVVITEPGCVTEGVRTFTCRNDSSHTRTEAIPAKGHVPGAAVRENEVPAGCETAGSYERTVYCSVCGEELERKQEYLSPLGHAWSAWSVTKPASCEADGEESRVCRNEASHVQTRKVSAPGHEWTGWTVEKEATETEEGLKTRVCRRDSSHTESRTIPRKPHEHVFSEMEAREPGCTDPGYTAYWICDRGENPCGRCFSDAEGTMEIDPDDTVIPAAGHNWGDWEVTKKATETEEGEEYRVCSRNADHEERRTIPMPEHVHRLNAVDAEEPGCETSGHTAYWICDGGENPCGRFFSDASGETEIDEKDTLIPAPGHDWGGWEVTKEATETEEGLEMRTCVRNASHTEPRVVPRKPHVHVLTGISEKAAGCEEPGHTAYWVCDGGENPCGRFFPDAEASKEIREEDTVIPAAGHEWDGGTVTVEPGCTTEGVMTYTCLHDSTHTRTEEIAPGGHASSGIWEREVILEPTCTTTGYSWMILRCRNCGEQLTCRLVKEEATGHVWGAWEVTKAASCDGPGEKHRVCGQDSSHEEVRETAALGHDWGYWEVTKPASCEESGEERSICRNDASHVRGRDITALGHDWSDWEEKKDASGRWKERVCSRCGSIEKEDLPDDPDPGPDPGPGPPPEPVYYTVRFRTDGHGAAPKSQKVKAGERAVEPIMKSNKNWLFSGWVEEPDEVYIFDFEQPITKDMTLYAKWVRSYNGKGGYASGGDEEEVPGGSGSDDSSGSDSSGSSSSAGGNWLRDSAGWHYVTTGGSWKNSGWAFLNYMGRSDWYSFDDRGAMQTGWISADGFLYYLNPVPDGWMGRMLTGWQLIDKKWYFFEPMPGKNQGHLYVNTVTPDGFRVGPDGAWQNGR